MAKVSKQVYFPPAELLGDILNMEWQQVNGVSLSAWPNGGGYFEVNWRFVKAYEYDHKGTPQLIETLALSVLSTTAK